MAQFKADVLDQITQVARFVILLINSPSYWFSLNTSCDHAFHLSKRLGMDQYNHQELLIAGILGRYNVGD